MPAPPAGSVTALRARFRDGKAALLWHFAESRATTTAATRLLRALARHVDASVTDLWAQAGLPPQAALVAVGGYGRGELFPHSDVDVLVLLPAEPNEAEQPRAIRVRQHHSAAGPPFDPSLPSVAESSVVSSSSSEMMRSASSGAMPARRRKSSRSRSMMSFSVR